MTEETTREVSGIEAGVFPSGVQQLLLIVTAGECSQIVSLLNGEERTIGRGEQAAVRIAEPSLSRLHARFHRFGDSVRVSDLASRNGTVVNGTPVSEASLRSGDTVVLGTVTVTVQVVAPARPLPVGHGPNPPEVESSRATPAKRRRKTTSVTPIRRSPAMLELGSLVERVAPRRIPVLILGETGSGKEVVAREIHDKSPRKEAPLTAVNCATIPENLVESVLFGHVKGAFTGADRNCRGVFEEANGGTVLLDEVGELRPSAQAALLRTLDTGRIVPIGSGKEIQVDVRVLAATHRDLRAMVDQGTFRLDLFHRLNVMTITVPPLRERREEIRPLAEHFARAFSDDGDMPFRGISPEVLERLEAYYWPGNVRELRNVVERAMVLADGAPLSSNELPEHVRASNACSDTIPPPVLASGTDAPQKVTLRSAIQDAELELIRSALAKTNGHQARAAEILNIPLRTLERKIQRLGLGRNQS